MKIGSYSQRSKIKLNTNKPKVKKSLFDTKKMVQEIKKKNLK